MAVSDKLELKASERKLHASEAVMVDLGDVTEQFAYQENADADLRANEVSDQDLRVSLKNAVTKLLIAAEKSKAPGSYANNEPYIYCDIAHVFSDTFVYYHAGKYWSLGYSVADEDTGAVELSGEPEEVRSITRYVAAEEDQDSSDENEDVSDDVSDAVTASSESSEEEEPERIASSFASAVLNKFKQLLKTDLTSDGNNPHTSEVEQRSSESNDSESNDSNASSEEKATEENIEMAQEKKNTRTEAIDKLVANEHVSYTKDDAEWLAELSDKAFERIEVVAYEAAEALVEASEKKDDDADESTEEKKEVKASDESTEEVIEPKVEAKVDAPQPKKTAEEYIASLDAPSEITRMFARAIETEKKHRADLVKAIKANGANKFSDKQLGAMDTDMLESIAAFAKPEADFAGKGDHTVRRASTRHEDDTNNEPIPMPSLSFGLGSARNHRQ